MASKTTTSSTTIKPTIIEVDDGYLVIKLPLQKPTPSGSGKNLVIASTHGNMSTQCMHEGKPITVGVNAYVKA